MCISTDFVFLRQRGIFINFNISQLSFPRAHRRSSKQLKTHISVDREITHSIEGKVMKGSP